MQKYMEMEKKMNIGMILLMIFGGGLAVLTTGYLCVSIFVVLGYKIMRKVKYGTSLYN